MADVYSDSYNAGNLFAAEKGNGWTADYGFQKSGVLNGDKLYLGMIPAGVRVSSVRLINAAAGAGATLSLGYEPIDGTPAAALTAFLNAQSVAAAANTQSSAFPITFDRPVKLVATVGGANFTGSPQLAVVIHGEMVGAK